MEKEEVVKLLYEIKKMTGIQFERQLCDIFDKLGYREVVHRGGPDDKGRDITMKDKNGSSIVVQAKRWKNPVQPEAIVYVWDRKETFGADEAWLVTSGKFSKTALQRAREKKVKTVGWYGLRKMVWKAEYYNQIKGNKK